ncbi:MAG: flap endonuclease [Firmicutes bacterium]|nr:flap endonuclease [Bacillota bacterium]
MKLLLVDGSMLYFQMYFGLPARIPGKDGRPVHGVLGFVGALIKIIKFTLPTHAAVLFDGEHELPRTGIDPAYKANRAGDARLTGDENPFSQLPGVYAALERMGVARAEIMDAEADDVIAAYAIAYGNAMPIVIASLDSDFFQFINENVSVLRYRGDNTYLCGSAYVQGRFGIPPRLYADFKSLVGDASDNIKGADKIGPKTAAALLNRFESLEAVIERADEITRPSVRESVVRNAGRLRNNYRLIQLDGAAEMPFAADELRYGYNGVTTTEVLTEIGVM